MTVLSSEQRKLLSDVVVRAREVVEAACAQRINALGVAADKAPITLTVEERAVRVGLRARARQVGSVDALVTEAGFEHWHRMLFARFLADNHLLVDEQYGQPLTMDEVAEYAAETGETDKWEVAARLAAAMLPGIFTQDDPILGMRLPVETRQELERLLDQLPVEVITAEDSLGWVYQYWQSRRKDEVNKSERKIGGADLAPVTQLFTESYMVRFLLENSLGAWWAARHPNSPLLTEWEYLRRNEDGSPAVGGFDGWPDRVAEVTVMDPCCGSGHFLTAAFGMLWRMRAEEEGLDPAVAQDAVLRDNLFGLELDPRCTQIAMFALALEAWKAGGHRELPLPNVACCGIPARAPLSDWLDLAGGDSRVQSALTRLHALFVNADTLGSLIDPVRAAEQAGRESVDWADVAPLVQEALTAETSHDATDPAAAVFGHAAAGIARAADYLGRRYILVCTNVPYLTRTRHSPLLATFAETSLPAGRADLATMFIERCRDLLANAGTLASVTPQNWLFLGRYSSLREQLLHEAHISFAARLGPGAFSSITGEVVKALLIIVCEVSPGEIVTCDIADGSSIRAITEGLASGGLRSINQVGQTENPDFRITLADAQPGLALATIGNVWQGIAPSDTPRFVRCFWENAFVGGGWVRLQSRPSATEAYGGRELILYWEDGFGRMTEVCQAGASFRGQSAWGRNGVAVAQMGSLAATLYSGSHFDGNAHMIVPNDPSLVPAIWAWILSGEFAQSVRAIDNKLSVTNATMSKVPFDSERWRQTATELFPHGLPEPFSDDPTQWLFRGEVAGSRHPLQVAVSRLLGFRWPDQEPEALDVQADEDGIVCLPAVGGESAAEERVRTLLATAYGDSWNPQSLDLLLAEAGAKPGSASLEKWLRDGFFKDHCKVFANRPFIWQIWDGRPDGFSTLVNYHKLDRKLLERLTYDYLGSWWIGRLNDEIRQQVPGAEIRLAAAEELKAKLELILEGEPPYDIFVRWKSLAEQSMGWEPDLDDGVRLNIRPFMTAGILRAKPNIKWTKDRGKNSDGSERLNDLHFTLAEKRAAREGAGP